MYVCIKKVQNSKNTSYNQSVYQSDISYIKHFLFFIYVTRFEKSHLPHIQHQDTLFTINDSCTRSLTIQAGIDAEICCGLFLRPVRRP